MKFETKFFLILALVISLGMNVFLMVDRGNELLFSGEEEEVDNDKNSVADLIDVKVREELLMRQLKKHQRDFNSTKLAMLFSELNIKPMTNYLGSWQEPPNYNPLETPQGYWRFTAYEEDFKDDNIDELIKYRVWQDYQFKSDNTLIVYDKRSDWILRKFGRGDYGYITKWKVLDREEIEEVFEGTELEGIDFIKIFSFEEIYRDNTKNTVIMAMGKSNKPKRVAERNELGTTLTYGTSPFSLNPKKSYDDNKWVTWFDTLTKEEQEEHIRKTKEGLARLLEGVEKAAEEQKVDLIKRESKKEPKEKKSLIEP